MIFFNDPGLLLWIFFPSSFCWMKFFSETDALSLQCDDWNNEYNCIYPLPLRYSPFFVLLSFYFSSSAPWSRRQEDDTPLTWRVINFTLVLIRPPDFKNAHFTLRSTIQSQSPSSLADFGDAILLTADLILLSIFTLLSLFFLLMLLSRPSRGSPSRPESPLPSSDS